MEPVEPRPNAGQPVESGKSAEQSFPGRRTAEQPVESRPNAGQPVESGPSAEQSFPPHRTAEQPVESRPNAKSFPGGPAGEQPLEPRTTGEQRGESRSTAERSFPPRSPGEQRGEPRSTAERSFPPRSPGEQSSGPRTTGEQSFPPHPAAEQSFASHLAAEPFGPRTVAQPFAPRAGAGSFEPHPSAGSLPPRPAAAPFPSRPATDRSEVPASGSWRTAETEADEPSQQSGFRQRIDVERPLGGLGRSTATQQRTASQQHTATQQHTGTERRLAEDTGFRHRAGENAGETTERRAGVSPGQTATGHHRAIGNAAGRRRIAKWPIVAGAFVVLLVVGLLGWGWANNVLNSRAEAQANGCAEGDATMKVLVTPAIEKPIDTAATRWNQARTVVHAHCVHIDVTPMASERALDALTGRTDIGSIGGLPAAWIAENPSLIGQLQAADPAMIAAPPEPIASAPSADYQFVGLTGPTPDEVQARAAQVFRDYLREPAQQADFTAAGLTSR